jgi:outer membrane protein OmpA-like peptidoglycan-associated protein
MRHLCLALLVLVACKDTGASDNSSAPPAPPELAPVQFAPGSDKLSFDDRPAVVQAAAELERNPQLHLLVIGRTDSRGGAQTNMQLGLQRAREMREAILNKAQGKVDLARVHIGSRGQAEPTGNNDTDEGRAANRRVEFFFYVPDGTDLKSHFASPIIIEN